MTLRTLMQAGPAKASELFARLAETSGGALKTRERLFEELKAELETHVGLEERHLFPVLRKHAETKGLVAAAIKDNKELRALLAELDALPKDDEAFPARLSELREAFRQHARDETKELLPAVRKALSEEQVQDVTERMEAGLAEAEQAKRDEEEERRAAARQERERAEAREQQEEEAERERQAAARRTREAALQTARAVTRTAEATTEVAAEGARQASRSVAEGAENLATAAPLSTGFLFWDMWLGMAGLQPSRPAPSRGRADASSAKDASGQQEQVIPLAEEVLTVGTKKVSAGTARIRRYVVETPVEKQVALVRERVVVERRRPVADRASGETLTEVTVEVTETDEVPVVGKAVRLREEVVIRTERAERVETVRDTVRRDEVEVERADRRAARLRAPAARA
ncbi:MAG: DUF2382 domain-containing protein [Acetobacteraceae bacterium]|nr:DUF2382 domain-containing protein [Acetobacteraceae bacterium]